MGVRPVSDGWTQKSSMPASAVTGVGFAVGAKGYIACGNNGANLNDLWEFDPVLATWTQRSSLPAGVRVFAAAFSIGPHGYVVGGIGGQVLVMSGDTPHRPSGAGAPEHPRLPRWPLHQCTTRDERCAADLRSDPAVAGALLQLGLSTCWRRQTTTATALNLAEQCERGLGVAELRHATHPSVVVASLSVPAAA